METTLHRQLKALYAGPEARVEQRIAGFRIDAVRDGQLVEIQHGGLAAIRTKIARLLEEHEVLVVKPLVVRKQLVKLSKRGGKEVSRRLSPKQGVLLDPLGAEVLQWFGVSELHRQSLSGRPHSFSDPDLEDWHDVARELGPIFARRTCPLFF